MYAALLLFLVPAVLANSGGPPVTAANPNLCTNMIPTGHNNGVSMAPDAANPPYTITTSSDKYTAGGTVTVTITGMGDNMFKGFFIQARRADPAMDNNVAIGTFSDPPATTKLLECHSVANSAWSHSNSDARSTIAATWVAPMQEEGPIEFKATIVKGVPDRSYFYLNVMSSEVAFMAGTQPPAVDTTPSTGGVDTTPSKAAVDTTPSTAAVDTTPSTASVTVPLALTTLALGIAALMAARRE